MALFPTKVQHRDRAIRSCTAWWQRTVFRPTDADRRFVADVTALGSRFDAISDTALADEIAWLRHKIVLSRGQICESDVRTVFALVNEALFRSHGFRYYEVQLLGGLMLARGCVAQMQTGEGKTLTAALPAALFALRGEGVHVATVNDYLAERDQLELAPIYERIGLSSGLIKSEMSPEEKRRGYACDVTYGTGCEFGFDYLRDQLTLRARLHPENRHQFRRALRGQQPTFRTVQRGLAISIVDEIDSVLIDDAATPLILAGGGDQPAPDADAHEAARATVLEMRPEEHFRPDHVLGVVELTACGHEFAQARPRIPTQVLNRPWTAYIETALRAEYLMHRDVHYILRDDEVRIVDQSTGRIQPDRQWQGGLHQAVQTKERVPVLAESKTLARITRQRFYQLYKGVCGMTGTAEGGAGELRHLFGLRTAVVPTARPSQRVLLSPLVFATAEQKWDAIAHEVRRISAKNRPVLVGTQNIADSETLCDLLRDHDLKPHVLNGKQDADEADVIARAGAAGRITIATNMAGRGTDIRLSAPAKRHGGLHVIAAGYHDSPRIDRQLIGRCGRQGDPGTAQFVASADDRIFVRYDQNLQTRIRRDADVSGRTHQSFEADIRRLQRKIQRHHRRSRAEMYEQDRIHNEILRLGPGG